MHKSVSTKIVRRNPVRCASTLNAPVSPAVSIDEIRGEQYREKVTKGSQGIVVAGASIRLGYCYRRDVTRGKIKRGDGARSDCPSSYLNKKEMRGKAKQRRKTLPLKKKIELITEVETNPSKLKKTIAQEFGITNSTLSTIVRDKEKYRQQYSEGEHTSDRVRYRKARKEGVDLALLQWVKKTRSSNVPASRHTLKLKAEEFARQQGIRNWSCSHGWLSRFGTRHNITFNGQPPDEHPAAIWLEDVLKPTLKRYDPKDVFSAHETGLLWRLLPEKTLDFKFETYRRGNKAKERLTVMVCANMAGTEKLPLLVIGRYSFPRCFKNVNQLPVAYTANKNSWMTPTIFKDWLESFDKTMRVTNRRVLLVVAHCPAHPQVQQTTLTATELLFIPPNSVPKLLPCDQGIIQNLKVHFRKMVLMKLSCHLDAGGEAGDFDITLLDAISDLKLAWDKVTPATIKNCFIKAYFKTDEETVGSIITSAESFASEPLLSSLFLDWNVSPSEYFTVDEALATCCREGAITEPPSTATSQDVEPDDVDVEPDDVDVEPDGVDVEPDDVDVEPDDVDVKPDNICVELHNAGVKLDNVYVESHNADVKSDNVDMELDNAGVELDSDGNDGAEETVSREQVLGCVRLMNLYLLQTNAPDSVFNVFTDFRLVFGNYLLNQTQTNVQASTRSESQVKPEVCMEHYPGAEAHNEIRLTRQRSGEEGQRGHRQEREEAQSQDEHGPEISLNQKDGPQLVRVKRERDDGEAQQRHSRGRKGRKRRKLKQ